MNFKKNFAIASVLFCFSSSVLLAQNINYKGFYVGVSTGYGTSSSGYYTVMDATPAAIINQFGDLASQGLSGGLHFDYNVIVTNKFLLGLEIGAGLSNQVGKENLLLNVGYPFNPIETLRFEKENSLSLALRLGTFPINDLLTYVSVGIENAKWSADYSPFNNSNPIIFSKDKRLTGLQYGLGIEMLIDSNWVIGGEWIYIDYVTSLDMNGVLSVWPFGSEGSSGGILKTFNTLKPDSSEFRLKVSYKFC